MNHPPTYVRTFSLHTVRENCHFLDHPPTPMSLRNIKMAPYKFTFHLLQANPLEDLEDAIELESRQSRNGRMSKSCAGSPDAYVKSKTVTAFMHTELHYKERSFHRHETREQTLRKFRHALSTPNLADNPLSLEKDFNLITEVHMKRNDFMLKVITS